MSLMKRTTPIDHNYEMMRKMKIIMDKEKLCDVMLIAGVDGKRIPTNRLLLAAASEYFEAMFMGALMEATEQQITIQDIDGNMLQTLITFCYTGDLNLREDNVRTICSSAQFLLFNSVVDQCTEFLENNLSPSNCLGIKYFAEQYYCSKLQYRAQNYICEYIHQVTKSDEFFKLSADRLCDLMARDDLNVGLEEDIFRFLMSWVQHDESNRKQNIPKLLLNIRLPLIISDHVKEICIANECTEIQQNAIESQSNIIKPRCWSGGCLMAFGSAAFEKYCSKLNQWTCIEETTIKKDFVEIIVWKEKLVITGGDSWRNVKYYDVELKSWKELCPLNIRPMGLVVLGESLYAVGGYELQIYVDYDGEEDVENVFYNNMYRLDSLTSSWQSVAPMPKTLSHIKAAAFDGCIYVEGAFQDTGHLLRYNPNTNQWTDLDQTSEDPGSLVVIKDQLYSVTAINDINLYNKETNSWTKCGSSDSITDGIMCLCAFNNRLLILMYDNSDLLLKEYIPEENVWINLAPPPMSLKYDLNGCIYIPPTLSNYIM